MSEQPRDVKRRCSKSTKIRFLYYLHMSAQQIIVISTSTVSYYEVDCEYSFRLKFN